MVVVMVEVEMALEMALEVFMLQVVDILDVVSYLILHTAFLCEKEEETSDSNTIRFLLPL